MRRPADTWLRFVSASALLMGAAAFIRAHGVAEVLAPRLELALFPMRIGEWSGVDLDIPPSVREVLGEGDFMERLYRRPSDASSIDLFIAYFPTQRTGSTIHSPQHCLPGSGWMPIDRTLVHLKQPAGETARVNRYVIAKGLDRELVLYWYCAHGHVVASEYWAKFYLVADSIRMNRSDGALIRIITPLSQAESTDDGQVRVVDFAYEVMPSLDKYIPR